MVKVLYGMSPRNEIIIAATKRVRYRVEHGPEFVLHDQEMGPPPSVVKRLSRTEHRLTPCIRNRDLDFVEYTADTPPGRMLHEAPHRVCRDGHYI